ncbi:LOW QUALITY PROTEIN: sister-chromatid cohesion protein 3 [Aristolochia californica]|uniref:LOW QUALITY PROTEIN: sister-chromatid cohesion protein 3 n=1 Tax=Aristolochia californica TaxID=171875 RepID=UPI0035DEC284
MDIPSPVADTSLRRSKRQRGRPSASEGVSAKMNKSKEKLDDARNAAEESPNESEKDSERSDDFEEVERRPKKKVNAATSLRKTTEQSLIEIIKGNGKLIPNAVKAWVERYEDNSKSATVELLTTLFESCGAKYQLDEASLDETSVDDVVLVLVGLAKNGEVDDWYTSKSKEYKNFKENLSSFWDNLVIECQNGPLFDQILFEKCMDYVIALSCTPPRVYRVVGSIVGLQLVTSFITVAKALAGQRETTQRQLTAEKKKRHDGPRLESLSNRLSATHEKITAAEEMMRKIYSGLFMHRYRDIDPDIRQMSIKALGVWIVSYPSLFLQDMYLKYLGWTLNDKVAAVRKTSIFALQNLYEVDDIVPSLGLFTERFCNRMVELADDIDVSVAVSAIGLLKQLLRHELLAEDELGPLYDLLIDEPPAIRRAIGELVYEHLIAQKFASSQSGSRGEDNEASEVHLARLLQILREFSKDPILSAYVIDDVWDDMKAMKDWKCIISMLLDENPSVELTDVDATSLVRLLCASVRKAVGEKIVPATDNRKQYYTKAQKEVLENSRREITAVMIKRYSQLLRKYLADKEKVSLLVELIVHLKLELYSLKRQEQNFKTVLQLIKDAFFKHGEKETLRSCVKAITFCVTESKADLQDFAENKLKELENELIVKIKSAIKEVAVGDDDYSLLVNLKRLYELQLSKSVPVEGFYEDMAVILKDFKNTNSEVLSFLLLNMYLHIAWCLYSIDSDNVSEASVSSLLAKRDTLFNLLEHILDSLLQVKEERSTRGVLPCRVVVILAELWCLFKKPRFLSTKLEALGFSPETAIIQKFWKVCEQRLDISDETEEEDVNEEYIEETNRDAVMIAAAKLVATNTVPKDYLGSEIVSHFVIHGTSVAEIVKHLISFLKKTASNDIPDLFLEAMRKAYMRHVEDTSRRDDESVTTKSFVGCKDLAARLSGLFIGAARNKHRSHIQKIVVDGISFAFVDAPKHLAFLEAGVLPFVSKLPTSDVIDILKDVEQRSEDYNTDEDPSGWRPYYTFVNHLQEKYSKNDALHDGKEGRPARGRPRKTRNVLGKRLFDGQGASEDDDSISESDQEEEDQEEPEEEERPLIHSLRSSASKLRLMRVSLREKKGQANSAGSARTPN